MNKLYSQGFVNIDGGVTYGYLLDDSDYYICIELRKFKETDFKKRGDEMVGFLSKRLKDDLKTRHWDNELKEYVPDFKDLTDEEREDIREKVIVLLCRSFDLVKK